MWQPIETAPKDGTVILLLSDGVDPGFFYLGEWHFWDGTVVQDEHGNDAGYLNSWLTGYGPTHWLPLPELPKNFGTHENHVGTHEK